MYNGTQLWISLGPAHYSVDPLENEELLNDQASQLRIAESTMCGMNMENPKK